MGQRPDGVDGHSTRMVKNFLELRSGIAALSQLQILFTSNVRRIYGLPKFVGRSCHKGLDGLGRIWCTKGTTGNEHLQSSEGTNIVHDSGMLAETLLFFVC